MSTVTNIMYISGMVILGIIGIGVCSYCGIIICYGEPISRRETLSRETNNSVRSITVMNPALFSEKQNSDEVENKREIVVEAVPIEIIDINPEIDNY